MVRELWSWADLQRSVVVTSTGNRAETMHRSLELTLTRYAIGITVPEGYDRIATLAGLCEALDRIPSHLLKSVTLDQGSEWAEWETLKATFNIDVWFCDPHSPWQRGQIENQNRAWRFWFPRGTRLDNLDQAHVDEVAAIINGQRRRNLDYQRPTDLYHAATVQ